MKKILSLFLFLSLSIFMLSGCQPFWQKSPTPAPAPAPTPSPPANNSNSGTNSNNSAGTNPGTNNNSTNTNTQTTQDPAQTYGAVGFADDFNNVIGTRNGITMGTPKLYQQDANNADFSITLSDGNGAGLVVVKQTLKVKEFSIASQADSAHLQGFYKDIGLYLQYIDNTVTPDQVNTILNQLGQGETDATKINGSYDSTDLSMKTFYDSSRNLIFFDVIYVNN